MVTEQMREQEIPIIDGAPEADPALLKLAGAPNTAPETLAALAESNDVFVRATVAQNPNTPPETLEKLLREALREGGSVSVADQAAGNASLPESTMRRIALLQVEGARAAVALNPSLPEDLVQTLAKDPSPKVRGMIAWRKDTSPELLTELSRDEHPRVRYHVVKNEATPKEVIRTLLEDDDPEIRWIAKRLLDTCANEQ